MRTPSNRKFRSEGGFTLVELLVVIVILGILIAIAVPTFLNQQSKANDASAQTSLNTTYKVAKAISVYYDGKFVGGEKADGSGPYTASELASDIQKSEPELTVTTTGSDAASVDPATLTTGTVYITGATDGKNLEAVEKTQSGDICTLEVTDESPTYSCASVSPPPACTVNCSGAPASLASLPVADGLQTDENPFPVGKNGWQAVAGYPAGVDTAGGWGKATVGGSPPIIVWDTPVTPAPGDGTAAAVTINGYACSSTGGSFYIMIDKPTDGLTAPKNDGYAAEFTCAGNNTGELTILRTVNGAQYNPAKWSSPFPVNIGTRIAVSDLDGTVTAWADSGNGFQSEYTYADTSFSSGYAGLEMSDNFYPGSGKGQKLTDFSYGEFSPSS